MFAPPTIAGTMTPGVVTDALETTPSGLIVVPGDVAHEAGPVAWAFCEIALYSAMTAA